MRVSRKKLRRLVAAILFFVSVNSFGIGWWWLRNQNDALLSQHRHVPHPLHHLQENRLLHNRLHGNERKQPEHKTKSSQHVQEPLLNCSRYGGPHNLDALEEMVYWKTIPQDLLYQSRFKNQDQTNRRFLTFDTDLAGFNNARMVFEINLLAAIVTGRTLVLPRRRSVTHLNVKTNDGRVAMLDFFDLKAIAAELPDALDIMTIDEFIASEGGPDQLNIPTNFTGFYERTTSLRSNKTIRIPNGTNYHDSFLLNNLQDRLGCSVKTLGFQQCANYTDWIDQKHRVPSRDTGVKYAAYFLDQYLNGHPKVFAPKWGAYKCLLAIPNRTDDARYKAWVDAATDGYNEWTHAQWNKRRKPFVGHPTSLKAPPPERLAQVFWVRDGICVYGQDQQSQQYWHMGDFVDRDSRLIGHWYDYLFFEDWNEDLWAKRFVRDKMKYNDQIQCAAARIVQAIRTLAKQANHGDDTFHTLHIRRTDLTKMYKDWGVDQNASVIYEEFATKRQIIPEGSVVYIATDEKDKSFFDVFRDHYAEVYFLEDFQHVLGPDFPTHYYGMVEQLVCARGTNFVGTFYSTFTGYINRLRGYHSQKELTKSLETKPGQELSEEEIAIIEQGRIRSWFYAPSKRVENYQHFTPIGQSLFEMEYAYAWRNIDYDVDPILREAVDRLEAKKKTATHSQRVDTTTTKLSLGADGFIPTKQIETKTKQMDARVDAMVETAKKIPKFAAASQNKPATAAEK